MFNLSNKILSITIAVVAIVELSLLLFLANPVKAAGTDINLSVKVLPRPATDTINDFDFSHINSTSHNKVYL